MRRPGKIKKWMRRVLANELAGRDESSRNAKLIAALERARLQYISDLDRQSKVIDDIIKRHSVIEFQREDGGMYAVMIRFTPKMVGYGGWPRDDLDFIARRVGQQVEREIASSKFIQKADDRERRMEEYQRERYAERARWRS